MNKSHFSLTLSLSTRRMEAETQNTLKGLFRLVSEFVQDEIKSNKSIADLNQRIDGITEAQNHSRVNVFNEIVRTYPYPELRECDREIFKSMCLNGKKSLEVIEDKYSLGEALRLWKSKEETPEKLKTLAQSALAPLNIHKKNNDEIQQLLEYSVNKANKKELAVRKSVTEWLLTIKRAIDAREKVRRERQSRRPRNEIADVEAVRKMMSLEKDIINSIAEESDAAEPVQESDAAEPVHSLTEHQRKQLGKLYTFGAH